MLLPIKLAKATDTKTSMKRGYQGQPTQTVIVQAKAGVEKVTSIDDIEKVLQYGELQQLYDTGNGYIEVNAKEIKDKTIEKTEMMTVIQVIPLIQMTNFLPNGSHYFVTLQKDKRSKKVPEDWKLIYTLLKSVLMQSQIGLVIKYTSRSENYALLYAGPGGLQISHIYPSNLIRYFDDIEENMVVVGTTKEEIEQYEGIQDQTANFINNLVREAIEPIIDKSEERLHEVIDLIIAGKEVPDLPQETAKPLSNLLSMFKQNLQAQDVKEPVLVTH